MASPKANDPKASEKNRKDELDAGELDKVSGGVKKNTTGGRGKTSDPCSGGE